MPRMIEINDLGWVQFSPDSFKSKKKHYVIGLPCVSLWMSVCGDYIAKHEPWQITPSMLPNECSRCKDSLKDYFFDIIRLGIINAKEHI